MWAWVTFWIWQWPSFTVIMNTASIASYLSVSKTFTFFIVAARWAAFTRARSPLSHRLQFQSRTTPCHTMGKSSLQRWFVRLCKQYAEHCCCFLNHWWYKRNAFQWSRYLFNSMRILHILFADVNVLNGALIVIRFPFAFPTFQCADTHTLSLSLIPSLVFNYLILRCKNTNSSYSE